MNMGLIENDKIQNMLSYRKLPHYLLALFLYSRS